MVLPPDADAARSSGRVGGSSFRSRGGGSRASMGGRASTSVRPRVSNNVYVAPPVVGGYGLGYGYGYGYGGGVAVMPPSVYVAPSPIGWGFSLFSGLFQFAAVAILLSVVVSFFTNIGKGSGDDEDTL